MEKMEQAPDVHWRRKLIRGPREKERLVLAGPESLASEWIAKKKSELVDLLSKDPENLLSLTYSKGLITPAEGHWLRKYPVKHQMAELVEVIIHKKKSLTFLQLLAELYGKAYRRHYRWIMSVCLEQKEPLDENRTIEQARDPVDKPNLFVKPCPLETRRHIQDSQRGEIYSIGEKNNRTRLAIIINNMKFRFVDSRDGSEVDTQQMKTLLEALDYRVEVVENQTAEEMEMCLSSFSKRKEHKTSDSTFVVIMSHGTEEGICGVDYNPQHSRNETILTTKAIGRIFSNDHSLNLVGKPKIIIIQACRGDHKGFVMIPTNKGDDEECLTKYDSDSPLNKIHKESDLVFFCSTTPGTRAYRHRKNGTMFIQRLVETFRNHAWNFHIEDLFKKVQRSFHNFPQQLPCKERTTLLRNFYLFPGH